MSELPEHFSTRDRSYAPVGDELLVAAVILVSLGTIFLAAIGF